MNVYALIPLFATIAYIPLLLTTLSSRPWQKRHTLFILFLIPATLWSLVDYVFRSQYFPQYSGFLFNTLVFMLILMMVQLHCFTSSFFPSGKGRWLSVAYFSLGLATVMLVTGYAIGPVVVKGDIIYGSYKIGIYVLLIPLLILVTRNLYVFINRLRVLDNPVLYNQILSLVIGISVLVVFVFTAFIPVGKPYPISHIGNIVNAFVLGYAVIRHQLVDIRIVLQKGSAWLVVGLIGCVAYWLLLEALHSILHFDLDLTASIIITVITLLFAVGFYKLRGFFFEVTNRAFQGSSYEYRQKLSGFANVIHNVFSLKEQGGELLSLLTNAVGIRQTCLLLPEVGSEDFVAQFVEPKVKNSGLYNMKLKADSPVVKYLEREQKPITRENLGIMPEFLSMWTQEREDIKSQDIELLLPLISRDRLIAILVLGKKLSGKYRLEDFHLLEDITGRVAVSIEKEYLREQLREREKELSLLNTSSTIISSSLDIQKTYDSFVEEVKKVIDISWAAIILIEGGGLCFLALSSEMQTDWHIGEKVPIAGSGTEWVIAHKQSIYEPDIGHGSNFLPAGRYLKWGLHSIVHLPLIAKGETIGSFIVASSRPNAYSQRHIMLLEQLAAQVAMPVANARLYAEVEERARVDELTGLLNRRSLDEMIDTEISRHSRYGGAFSLAIIDLDSFKEFNDSYGHPAGDELLRRVGRIIKSTIRSSDQAFRYGGDEFAILLPHTTIDDASEVMERVRLKIPKELEGGNSHITASIGLANWPIDGVGHTDIIAAADVTLYRAKRSGGNQSHCASGTLLPFNTIALDSEDNVGNRVLNVIYVLAETVDARSQYRRNHSKKVAEYTLAFAGALKMEPLEISNLEASALLHDIGKIGISDDILNKESELTAEEWQVIKTHPQLGAIIVGRVPQLASCIPNIRHHHEWYDGTGYPDGLKGEDIPLGARILAITNAFAAMTSKRPYSSALSEENALVEIKRGASKQFDPNLVQNFISICEGRLMAKKKT